MRQVVLPRPWAPQGESYDISMERTISMQPPEIAGYSYYLQNRQTKVSSGQDTHYISVCTKSEASI